MVNEDDNFVWYVNSIVYVLALYEENGDRLISPYEFNEPEESIMPYTWNYGGLVDTKFLGHFNHPWI